jgi:hypothetical protein
MYIKQLIKSEQEYWDYVWQLIDWSNNPNRSLWRDEDLPKLKPFFDVQHKHYEIEWAEEVKESFDFYQKCSAEYGEKNRELRDAVSRISQDDILEAFGYEIPEYNDENDYTKDKPLPLDKDFDATFPFIVVGDIYCGWDRSGDVTVLSLNRVSLKDFQGE